ncbi:hypothetical protein JGH11_11325 [Dysgonomonas sp. Marseille-P4677]|uniref:hypothetical protein n=1 Tax=Dysgonomonas sp. Marseille-P4677 TaxID=2364790 RepID=UPI001911473D|nr:hypothetical protein [Dysgonomonas sp. Marseille-P4677]MBK5721464.1 hypothetical protein [Dysgonomonas sp. Marseille-P4677]
MNFTFKLQYISIMMLIFMFVFHSSPLFSQVSIGATEEPAKGSLLQLKNIENIIGGDANANKGLLLPRINLTNKYELYPMFLKDKGNPLSGPDENYSSNKNELDKIHTGLVVYNMNEDYEKDLCLGINVWDGEKWECMYYPRYGYEMSCNSVQVHGVYWKGRVLDASNKITLKIIANDAKAIGKTYYIQTEEVDGVKFFGQGEITYDALTTTGQTITLQGKGIPTDREIKYFTLTANNISGTTCNAKVYVVIPKKNILVLGNGYLRGYNFSLPTTNTNKVFTSPRNFGTGENNIDPVFPYEMTSFLNGKAGLNNTYDAEITTAQYPVLKKALLEDRIVDILVLTHDVYLSELYTQDAQLITDYLKAGGVVVALWEANPTGRQGSERFMKKVFGAQGSSIVSHKINPEAGGHSGGVYALSNLDDPILNGPFGDVRSKYWGDDWFWTEGIAGLPKDEIIEYSNGKNWSGTTSPSNAGDFTSAFRHKTLNLVFFGDGGFIATGYEPNDTAMSTSDWRAPFWWNTTTMHPIEKPNYGSGNTKFSVQNSILFCNIMAWAIYQAETNGINPPTD